MYSNITLPKSVSILFYILIIHISTYYVWKADASEGKNTQNTKLMIAFLIITVPAALRYCVGQDQTSYLNLIQTYNNMYHGNLKAIGAAYGFHSIEYSFIFLAFIFRNHPAFVFAFYAIFTQLFMMKGIWHFRKEVSPALSFYIYMMIFYLRTYNIFRQSLAISIIFFSFRYIKERNLKAFLVCVLAATMIHDTAIIAIVLYWAYGMSNEESDTFFRKALKKLAPVVVLFCSSVFYNLVTSLVPALQRRTVYYALDDTGSSFLTIGTIMQCTIYLMYCCSKKYRINGDSFTYDLLDNTMRWNIVFHFLSFSMGHAVRVGLYFTMASYCGIASMHKKGEWMLKTKLTIYDIFIIVYCAYKLTNTLYTNMFSSLPYSFWII